MKESQESRGGTGSVMVGAQASWQLITFEAKRSSPVPVPAAVGAAVGAGDATTTAVSAECEYYDPNHVGRNDRRKIDRTQDNKQRKRQKRCAEMISSSDCDSIVPMPTPIERYRMLALGRFYKDEDALRLLKICRQGVWTFDSLKMALNALDTQDPINEYESREVKHIPFLNINDLMKINKCCEKLMPRVGLQAGTDSGEVRSWCKYMYIKTRADDEVQAEYNEFREVLASVEGRVHEEVRKTLNKYEEACFAELFQEKKSREISIVHYPCKVKGNKFVGIDAHIDDTIFRTAMVHLHGGDVTDNVWVTDRGVETLYELRPGDLLIFPRLSHRVKPLKIRKHSRRVCTFFF